VFFDLSPLEIVLLLVLSVVLFGPDKLPHAAASAARLLKQVRAFSESAHEQVRDHLGPEVAELDLRDLDPRTLVREHLLSEIDEVRDLRRDLDHDLATTTTTATRPRRDPRERYLDAT
jgi:sec-independent protein translocase protein TatB